MSVYLKDNLEIDFDKNMGNNDKIVKSLHNELIDLRINEESDEEKESLIETVIHNIEEE